MGWTTDRFLRGVKRRISMPDNNVLIDDPGILELADDMIKAHLVPAFVSVREDYFVKTFDRALVKDQANYDFPPRAIGLGLRDFKLRISTNNVRDLVRIALEEEHQYRSSGQTSGFYFRNDEVILVPPPSDATWVAELWHDQRPSLLTAITNAAVVTSVAGDVITAATVPSLITGTSRVDVIKALPGHRLLGMDLQATATTATTITLTTGTTPATIVAGDYIALAGTSPIIQLPDEAMVLLETLVAKRCTGSIGDYEARGSLTDDEREELKNLLTLISPRIEGENRKTVNRSGLLRGRGGHIRRGYYG